MLPSSRNEITQMLIDISDKDEKLEADKLFNLVYIELKSIARNYIRKENPDHTLQATGLVHEAYFKMVDHDRIDWKGKTHFMAVGAQAMRRILVDYARGKKREKRGGGASKVELDEKLGLSINNENDLVAIDDAIEKLKLIDERQAQIVELRFFGGMKVQEVADLLGVSKRTIESEWTMIKAWLRREIGGEKE